MRRLTALASVFAILIAMVAAGLVGTAAAQTASLADHPVDRGLARLAGNALVHG